MYIKKATHFDLLNINELKLSKKYVLPSNTNKIVYTEKLFILFISSFAMFVA